MKSLLALFSLLAIFSQNASAQWETGKSVSLTSQFVGSALAVINDGPVVQPEIHFNKGDTYGMVFGTFGLTKTEGNEVDLFLGKKWSAGAFTVIGEVATFLILSPRISILAPSVDFRHESGFNLKLEGRSSSGQNGGYQASIGYTSDWWNAEVRKVDFWGDNVWVPKINFLRKLDNGLTATLTLATTAGGPKRTVAVLSISQTF